MILQNRIIAETLEVRHNQLQEEKVDPVEVTIADFDGALYHLSNPEGDRNKVQISLGVKFYHELQPHGVNELMKREYGDMLVAPESGYDVTIVVDLAAMGADPTVTIMKAASLRRNCFAALFEKFFSMQQAGNIDEKAVLQFRDQETLYINVLKDRVTVIFSTLFSDADDVVIGKVFMQAFKDVRGKNPQAPQVLFSYLEPPRELEGTGALSGKNVGYVTFVLFPRHFEGAKKDSTIDLLHTFRDYLHYHIKCSKAYLHQRMRARTSELLKVLNRARPDSESKEKRTITGRTFSRSGR
ncbi:uncharacterized protein MONBRDRAFT_37027 [Monosiga brevicollis MX1]|uniref:Arp2/3 complex 34 kDa subunit n=2 Tax=Monosiga brevicollis TaxID=81824 RepID=A9UZ46_MONBE|nr:uncharacterized protein MONBRDRAFT_37027 [Monosiga brevicollis MX1]EDQ89569.1 predicted protein [Monosiga brevicollis MX1]|eukprot:XP_001745598.1 hypothetical protein [Monosiga brevicollis MX1]